MGSNKLRNNSTAVLKCKDDNLRSLYLASFHKNATPASPWGPSSGLPCETSPPQPRGPSKVPSLPLTTKLCDLVCVEAWDPARPSPTDHRPGARHPERLAD